MSNIEFSSAIYGDFVCGDRVFIAKELVKANSHMIIHLDDLKVDDLVVLYSADGRDYLGSIPATPSDVQEFRALVASITARSIYARPTAQLIELTDEELDCILIHRGLNA